MAFGAGLCSTIVHVILACFFFTYAFANPDGGKCYATVDRAIATSVAETKLMPGEFFDVSRAFQQWFSIGFVLCCSTLAYYIVGFLNFKCGKAELIDQLVTALGYLSVLGTLVWVGFGTHLRWSDEAKTCAGDEETRGANRLAPYQY